MSIKIIKLVNGDTLIAEVTHEDETHLHIIDPVQMIIQSRTGASPVCISTIWVPLTKAVNLLHLKQSTILVTVDVDDDMVEYYDNCLRAMREDGGTFFNSKKDSMTAQEIDELLKKLKIIDDKPKQIDNVYHLSANTSMH